MTDIITIRLFYPMLFIMITIIATLIIFAIKAILIKFKDCDSENFRFKTHIDEHIDTTSKMTSLHDKVIKVDFTTSHEKELDAIEKLLQKLDDKVEMLSNKVIKLEDNRGKK